MSSIIRGVIVLVIVAVIYVYFTGQVMTRTAGAQQEQTLLYIRIGASVISLFAVIAIIRGFLSLGRKD